VETISTPGPNTRFLGEGFDDHEGHRSVAVPPPPPQTQEKDLWKLHSMALEILRLNMPDQFSTRIVAMTRRLGITLYLEIERLSCCVLAELNDPGGSW
jgi:hypothetical protein